MRNAVFLLLVFTVICLTVFASRGEEKPPAAGGSPCVEAGESTNYCVDPFEYTNAGLAAFLNQHGNQCGKDKCVDDEDPGLKLSKDGDRWVVQAGFEDHPAVLVTWYGARAACQAEGKRLCKKSEWVEACGGPHGHQFPYGEKWDEAACNGYEAGKKTTVPVGSMNKCAGGYPGLFDMHGNVWEWVDDCDRGKCLVHGGSYSTYYNYMDCIHSQKNPPEIGEVYIGFRCCSDSK